MSNRFSFVLGRIMLLSVFFHAAAVFAVAPANDNFAAAENLGTLASVTTAGTTVEATYEATEPIYTGALESVWYKWTAPASGWKRVSVSSTETTISNNPGLAVYQGNDLGSLSAIGVSAPGLRLTRFQAVAGKVYYFQVIELDTAGAFSIALVNGVAPAAPANDNYASATTVAASLPRTGVSGTFVDATVELREPNAYVTSGRATVWYKWTPTSSVLVDIYINSSADTRFRVYTGSTLAALTEVLPRYVYLAYPDAYYQVTSGTTYYIQVGQNGAADRSFTLNLEAAPTLAPPANNAFASRTSLGNAATVDRAEETSLDATTETGEPLPVSSLTATVWYSWTAPESGAVEIKTRGVVEAGASFTNHDTFLCAYTGTTLASLALQGFNDDINSSSGDYDSSLVIPVTAGVTYQIQVGSAFGAADGFALTLGYVDPDFLPFRVLAFTASTTALNLTSASPTVTFDVTLSDVLENVDDLVLRVEMPTATAPWGGLASSRYLEGATPPVFVADTTYRFTRTFPAGLPAGTYPLRLTVANQVNGLADGVPSYGGKERVVLPGGIAALAVTNTGAVTAAPTLTAFTITPATVDASAGDVTVNVSVSATGLPVGNDIYLELTDTLGVDAFFAPGLLVHDGTAWKGSFTIGKGTPPMVYRPTISLYGNALGRDYGYGNALATALPAGSSTAFTITNSNPDFLPPQLKNFTLDTSAVSLSAGDVVVTGTCRITDASGLSDLQVQIDDGSLTYSPPMIQSRLSGTAQDGIYRWTMMLDHATRAFGYTIVVLVADSAGNALNLSPVFATWPDGLPSTLSVTSPSTDPAEVQWMALQNFTPFSGETAFSAKAINADPDGDGLSNLLEFYFDTNPASPVNISTNLPVVSRVDGQLRLDFGQSVPNLALGTLGSGLIGQYSTNLEEWTVVPITTTAPGFYRIVSPAGASGLGYLRLKAAPLP
jgi:hypothetical protein